MEYRFADYNAIAVADAAGFDRFSVLSTSGGVLPALHLAAGYPARVERLAIVGGYAEGRSRRGAASGPDLLRRMLEEGWDQSDGAFVTSYYPEGPFHCVRDLVRLMQSACSRGRILAHRDSINGTSVLHLLREVRCPPLMLHGRSGAVHPVSEVRKLAAKVAGAELVLLGSANHFPLPGTPAWEPFMETLVDFVSGSP